jgi:hypothetical protein
VGGIGDPSDVSEAMARLLALAPPPRSVAPQRVEAAERRLGHAPAGVVAGGRQALRRRTFDGWLTVFGPARVIAETIEFAATTGAARPPFAPASGRRRADRVGVRRADVALCWEPDGPPDGWPVVAVDRDLRTDRFDRADRRLRRVRAGRRPRVHAARARCGPRKAPRVHRRAVNDDLTAPNVRQHPVCDHPRTFAALDAGDGLPHRGEARAMADSERCA